MRLIFWLNGWLVRILCVVAVVVIAVEGGQRPISDEISSQMLRR